MLVSVSIKILN